MTPQAGAKLAAVLAAARGTPLLMGIVNVTPDSFSDGGRFLAPDAAIAEARRHVAGGASIVDIGAESTRPGFAPIDVTEERERLAPVLEALIASVDVAVSIDTTKAIDREHRARRGRRDRQRPVGPAGRPRSWPTSSPRAGRAS